MRVAGQPRFKRIRIALGVLTSTFAAGVCGTLLLFLSLGSFSVFLTPHPEAFAVLLGLFLFALSFLVALFYALLIAAPICLITVPIIALTLERFRLFGYRHAAVFGAGLGLIIGLVLAFGVNVSPVVSFFSDAARDSRMSQIGFAASHALQVAQIGLIGLITGLAARFAMGKPAAARAADDQA